MNKNLDFLNFRFFVIGAVFAATTLCAKNANGLDNLSHTGIFYRNLTNQRFIFGIHSTTPSADNTNKCDRLEHRSEPLNTSGLPMSCSIQVTCTAVVTVSVGDLLHSEVAFVNNQNCFQYEVEMTGPSGYTNYPAGPGDKSILGILCTGVEQTFTVTITITGNSPPSRNSFISPTTVTSCTVIVTVSDTVKPTVTCNGAVSYHIGGSPLSNSAVLISANDNCNSIGGYTLSKDSWTCADLGTVTYTTLTVTDTSGNVTSCTTQVNLVSPLLNNVTVTYTGVTLVTATNKSAPITLSASVTVPVGADVTQSQVRFIDRDTGQPISAGWEAITAGAQPNTGTASDLQTLTLGPYEIFRKYNIGIEVGGTGCYAKNSAADNVTVTLAEPSCGCY